MRFVERCQQGGVYTKSFRSIWLPELFAAGLANEDTNVAGRTNVVADFRFRWLRREATMAVRFQTPRFAGASRFTLYSFAWWPAIPADERS